MLTEEPGRLDEIQEISGKILQSIDDKDEDYIQARKSANAIRTKRRRNQGRGQPPGDLRWERSAEQKCVYYVLLATFCRRSDRRSIKLTVSALRLQPPREI